MSETARTKERKKSWLLGRVIRATATETAEALYERLRNEADAHTQVDLPLSNAPGDDESELTRSEVNHLLRMHDDLVKLLEHFEARAGVSKRQRRRLRQEIRLTSSLIARNLERLHVLGVVPMGFPEMVNFRLHEPVRTISTHTLADDGRVTDVYQNGFTSNGHVVRQAKVAVLKYVPKPELQPKKENQL